MKHLDRYFNYVVLMLVMLTTSCVPNQNQTYPTNIPLSSPVEVQLFTITPSPVPFATLPWTPYPTMSLDNQIQFYELLRNNGGCELPCFLGITPEVTSWQSAKSFLEAFALSKPAKPFPATVSIITNSDVSLDANIQAHIDSNDLIQHIIIDINVTKNDFTETHDKHLSWYSTSSLFKRYGIPDAIYLDYGPNDHETLGYSLAIVYEKIKLVIQYVGAIELNTKGVYLTCPNWGDGVISYMKIALANPSNPIDVNTLMDYPFWEGLASFEETSGMNINDFYKLMISDKQPVCFQGKQP